MGLEKAVVARPGVDPIFMDPQGSIIDGPFALYERNRYTESGIPKLLTAIEKNRELFPPSLVILGKAGSNEPEDWGMPVVRIERCPDAMTASLMQHARMCIYLSKGEGSGMTVLQAMTAGYARDHQTDIMKLPAWFLSTANPITPTRCCRYCTACWMSPPENGKNAGKWRTVWWLTIPGNGAA